MDIRLPYAALKALLIATTGRSSRRQTACLVFYTKSGGGAGNLENLYLYPVSGSAATGPPASGPIFIPQENVSIPTFLADFPKAILVDRIRP